MFRLNDLPQVTKNILLLNIMFFVVKFFLETQNNIFMYNLGLYYFTNPNFEPFQFVTYFFLHDDSLHLVFTVVALMFFGAPLEKVWGPQRFFIFYISCAIGAALLNQLAIFVELSFLVGQSLAFEEILKPLMIISIPVFGATGAIFGLLAAFVYLFPNTEINLFFFPIHVKAKHFIIVFAGLELYRAFHESIYLFIANYIHLGGALIGFVLVLFWKKTDQKNFY